MCVCAIRMIPLNLIHGSGGEKEGSKGRNELSTSIVTGMSCAPTEPSKPKGARTDLLSPLWMLSWQLACSDHTLG